MHNCANNNQTIQLMVKKQLYVEPQAQILVLQSEAIICESGLNTLDSNGIEQGVFVPDYNFDLL